MSKKIAVCLALGLIATSASAMEYTCQLENDKLVSVVVEKGKVPVYRYGTLGKTEITLPMNAKGKETIYVGQSTFIAGGSVYIRFQNGAFSYLLYSGSGRGWDFEGIAVYKNGKLINKKACKTGFNTDLYGLLESGIPMDPDEDGPYPFDPNSN
ncbi:TPA: hypothetical protein ACS7ZY_000406 [Providencia alcalifaciens]